MRDFTACSPTIINMSEPLVYLNGRFLPQSQASLSLHDAGFVMGATVTDLCRTFHHRLYRWSDHLARFKASCALTEIHPIISPSEITAMAEELVRYNARFLQAGQELALVIFATPGPIGYYLGQDGGLGESPVTFGMHTFPIPFARHRRWITQGAALVVPNVRQMPAECVDPHIKMRSRMHWWLAEREAQQIEPGSAALLLDSEGHITETAGANVLIAQYGKIFSPPGDRILEGISRRVVIELCAKENIPFEEKPLTIQDAAFSEEMLLTSTPFCLAGVSRFQGKPLAWPGKMLGRLLRAWDDEVGLDIHQQIIQS
jgi:branched-chain amino acid aminotransferase